MKPDALECLAEALDDIADDETVGVVIITISDTVIRVRSFGDQNVLAEAAKQTSEVLRPN